MDEKLKYLGITFDDVLLEPRYSEVVPAECQVATRLTRRIELKFRCSARRWTRSPKARWPSPWPKKAAWA